MAEQRQTNEVNSESSVQNVTYITGPISTHNILTGVGNINETVTSSSSKCSFILITVKC